jgi:hypothetical protein
MHSCEDCHYRGKDKRAPRFRHPFSPRHEDYLARLVISFSTAGRLRHDYASTGETTLYETSKFLSNDSLDPKKITPGMDTGVWYPSLKKWKGKFIPVKSLLVVYWGDLDGMTNRVKPVALWKIRDLKKPPLKDDDGDGIPEVNSLDEIKSFLRELKGR